MHDDARSSFPKKPGSGRVGIGRRWRSAPRVISPPATRSGRECHGRSGRRLVLSVDQGCATAPLAIKRPGSASPRWLRAPHSPRRTPRSGPRVAVRHPRPKRLARRPTSTTRRTLRCCSGIGAMAVAPASGAKVGRPSSLRRGPILERLSWLGSPPNRPATPAPRGEVASPAANLCGACVRRPSSSAAGNLQPRYRHADARRAVRALRASWRPDETNASVRPSATVRHGGRQRTGRAD